MIIDDIKTNYEKTTDYNTAFYYFSINFVGSINP